MLGIAGAGTFAGGCAERGGVGYDSRSGQLRPGVESRSLGESTGRRRLVGGWRIALRVRAKIGCVGELQPGGLTRRIGLDHLCTLHSLYKLRKLA